MPISYINHRGVTFYLCQGVTKTGKPRFYFARKPQGQPVEAIPEGYEITESVNGVVSLAKIKPVLIRPEEEQLVRDAVARHKKAHNYRVAAKGASITVYERAGADPDEVAREMARFMGLPLRNATAEVRDQFDQHARFSGVLRFTLEDAEQRTFSTERWSWTATLTLGWKSPFPGHLIVASPEPFEAGYGSFLRSDVERPSTAGAAGPAPRLQLPVCRPRLCRFTRMRAAKYSRGPGHDAGAGRRRRAPRRCRGGWRCRNAGNCNRPRVCGRGESHRLRPGP